MDSGGTDVKKIKNPKEDANFLSVFTFWWLRDLFRKGLKNELDITDVYEPLNHHKCGKLGKTYEKLWKQAEQSGKSPSLLKIIRKVHGTSLILVYFLYSTAEVCLRLAQPLCLGVFISYFSPGQTTISLQDAYIYATGVVLSIVLTVAIIHPFYTYLMHTAMSMKVACSSLIYRKILRVGREQGDSVRGQAVNLLANDVNCFEMAVVFLMELVRAPIEGALVTYILYLNIGLSSLIGIAFLLCFIPFQAYLGKIIANIKNKASPIIDHRIKLMGEIVQGIKVIKMYGWERCFAKLVDTQRKKEMNLVKQASWVKAVTTGFVKLNTRIAIFLSITAYILFGNQITASKIFVLYSLYDLIKLTVVEFFPLSIMFVLEAKVSIARIEKFLMMKEVGQESAKVINKPKKKYSSDEYYESESDPCIQDNDESSSLINKSKRKRYGATNDGFDKDDCDTSLMQMVQDKNGEIIPGKYLNMINVTAYWTDEETNTQKVALHKISLELRSKELLAIVGQVGSGKSTLLNAVLGEISLSKGSKIYRPSVSFCPQSPWLFEASIIQNILFGLPMDKERYQKVLNVCQLEDDIKILPYGDKTIVGEKGVILSGGQKARISLARCVYRKADLYLLDDPLASVDVAVANQIYLKCVRGFLKNKAVLLATNQLQLLAKDTRICCLQSGNVVYLGTFEELQSKESKFKHLLPEECTSEQTELEQENDDMRDENSTELAEQFQVQDNEIEAETRQSGKISTDEYLFYLGSGTNKCSIFMVLFLFCLAQAISSLSDLWISQWTGMEELSYKGNGTLTESNWHVILNGPNIFGLNREQCLYVYSGLICGCIILTINKLILFFNLCVDASINLHDAMFRGIARAKMVFFHKNSSGRILNRFSRDMNTVDTVLPTALIDCINFFLEIIGILVVVCIVNWWLLLPTGIVVILLGIVRYIYVSTGRSLKRLEGTCRSPIFSHVNATLQGLETVRACGTQNQLLQEFNNHQDLHSGVYSLVINTNRAFSFWMDIVCCLYLIVVTYSFLILTNEETFGGKVGLAITQVMGLVGMCQYGLRQTAEMENQMTAIERVREYTKLTSEPPLDNNPKIIKSTYPNIDFNNWPSKGTLNMSNMFLNYNESNKISQNVLNDINLTIKDGQKIGIIGRTGAGKSSMISAIYRLAEIRGTIQIDDVNIKDIGLHQLRTSMSIIPQEPVLFSGTLRYNLDPWNQYDDEQLWDALEEVEMKNFLHSSIGGLNEQIHDGGSNLSTGQRQLLCLARAILKRTKIILLDEATANVDPKTDKLIQKTIRRKFAGKTVITIAHRLQTVIDADLLVVMDKGKIIECDHPYNLLKDDDSTNKSSNLFKSLVEKTGKQTSEKLYALAEESFKMNKKEA